MTDFGRGYATCLRQFTFHAARLNEMLELYRTMRLRNAAMFPDDRAIELWANGASDHLYKLIRPRRGVPRVEWERAKRLQERALDIGHGFRPSSRSNPSEALGLLDAAASLLIDLERRGHAVATLDDCLKTDLLLGLRPDAGTWSCVADIRRERQA